VSSEEDRKPLRTELSACLGKDASAAELVDWVPKYFPDIESYRQSDDLVLRHGERFMFVRRVGGDRFRTSENMAAPSTNLVDFGGGVERNVDELIAEIAAFAAA